MNISVILGINCNLEFRIMGIIFYLQTITTDDILLEIKRLKHNKSPYQYFTESKVVKLCPEIFAMNLAKIYNWGIENRNYPDDLKIAKLIALYKNE